MADTEATEARQRIRAMDERMEAFDRMFDRYAADLARVRVVIDHAWEQDHRWDQFVAWVHGGPVPEMTPGAQAILVKHGRRNDPF